MSNLLEDVRLRIEALGVDFQFMGTIKTSMNGVERETWLLDYEGSQFVYVAGQRNVVLGWDVDQCPLGKGVLEGLQKEFELGHDIEQNIPSLSQAVSALKEGPFTLATEDEWEYLCNGGTRTLFRWGDTLEDILPEIYNVGCVSDRREKSLLEQPNMFGLSIAYNSYKYEIIDHTQYVKGGDGGCSLCGGDGGIYVLPCDTAFYRQEPFEGNYGLSKDFYCYHRIIRLS